jgi:hypothetical protein
VQRCKEAKKDLTQSFYAFSFGLSCWVHLVVDRYKIYREEAEAQRYNHLCASASSLLCTFALKLCFSALAFLGEDKVVAGVPTLHHQVELAVVCVPNDVVDVVGALDA